MRQFIEFLPIACFVAVYFTTKDIYLATGVLMGAVCVQVGYEYGADKAVSKRTQMIFWVAILAGGATLAFQDEMFIKWKPTVVNWLFSVALLASQFISKDNLLKKMLGEHLPLPDDVWRNLNYGWAAGFFMAGLLNLIVAYGFSTEFWVTYKLVGGIAITLFYMVCTMVYLIKGGYIQEDEDDAKKTPEYEQQ
jgi:intracellular septation protein